jgi:predicted RNase H-like nuclease (RuvC/YqgF family)
VTDKTKQILAMTLGGVGLAVAVLATVIALNARDTANSDQASSAEIQQQVSDELERRAAAEKKELNRVERFVKQLSSEEKGAVSSLDKLNRRVNRIAREVKAVESDQKSEYSSLDRRIDETNQRVANLRQQVQSLRNQVNRLEADNGP